MRISPETVQQIIQAADVTEVIGEYVSLKKRGANMIACCPFITKKLLRSTFRQPKAFINVLAAAKQVTRCVL